MADAPGPSRPPVDGDARDAEIARLQKVIDALVRRAERGAKAEGSDYKLFETAIVLEGEVKRRTAELETALHENERITRAMLYRDAILHAVTRSAAKLYSGSSLADSISFILRTVGEAVAADRILVLETSSDRPHVALRHSWHRRSDIVPVTPEIVAPIAAREDAAFAAWEARLRAGEAVATPRSLASGAVKDLFEALGIHSNLQLPIFVDGEHWGQIGIDDCSVERSWVAAEIDSLRILADLIGAAIARERYTEKLSAADTVVRSSPAVLYRLRGDAVPLRMVYVSDNVSVLGRKAADLLADPHLYLSLVHPHDRAAVAHVIAEVVRGGGAGSFEFRASGADGAWRWLENRYTPIRRPGAPLEIEGVLVDVTDRRRAEDALRETLERRQRQFEAVGAVARNEALVSGEVEAVAREITELAAGSVGCERVNVWLFNEDETELRCIDLYEATPARHSAGLLLREAEFGPEFRTIKASKYVNADDAMTDPRTSGYVEGYVKPLGITSMLDVVVGASDRSYGLLCFEHVGKPHHWEADEIAFAGQLADKIAFALGARERRQAEEKVRANEAALAAAQAIAHVGSWEHDPATGRLTWSPETYRIFGADPASFRPSYESLFTRVYPEDRDRVENEYIDSVVQRRACNIEHRIVLDDGTTRWVHERGETFYDADGRPVRSVGTAQDITERKHAEDILRRERDFTAALIDGLPGIFFVLDSEGRTVRNNANLATVTGWAPEQLHGLDALTNIVPAEHANVRRRMAEVFETGHAEDEIGVLHLDGSARRFFVTARRIQLVGGPGILGVGVDVTEARKAERLLRESEEKFRTVFSTATEGIFLIDPATGHYVDMNPSCCAMFGYRLDEIAGLKIGALSSGEPPYTQAEALAQVGKSRTEGPKKFEWRCKAKGGRLFWGEISTRYTAFGERNLVLGTIRDITDQKLAAAQILQMARYDALTGLANRRVFAEAVQQAIARAARGSKGFAVLYLDLDHFKDVNDTLGHPIGDLLLKSVAERLKACVRETDTVARFGGDEFAVLAIDINDPTDAGVLGEKILAAVSKPVVIGGNEIRSGTSVGISVYGPDSPEAELLLTHADVALYRAKSEGRGTYRFFTDTMDADVRKRVKLDGDLRTALDTDQLFLVYQPQVEAASGRILGVEALVRWRHPERGIVAPDEFVPAAEKNGLIVPLGRWVLRTACRQARVWREAGVPAVTLGVNLSALQFKTPLELEKDIAAALAESGLPAQMLELELTESVLMKASHEHNDVLLRLRNQGLRLAIDDFGTGFSSLDYLRRFPVDRIKIAQVFIIDLVTAAGDAAIVKAAIGLARELGINIIAEGVETEAQLRLLQAWGCREVQGYYFSRPLEAEAVLPILRGGRIGTAGRTRIGSVA